jgi:hypothetical protein
LFKTAIHRHSLEKLKWVHKVRVVQADFLGAGHWENKEKIFERWNMASAATARIFDGNSADMALTSGERLDSQFQSHAIPIVFLITDDISEQESLKSLINCQGWQFETFESAR